MEQILLNEIAEEIISECNRLAEHLSGMEQPATLEAIEVSFRQMMRRVGGRFIQECVRARGFGYQGKRISCCCGGVAEAVSYRKRQIQTTIGEAWIERAYYHCKACGNGFAPLDEQLGITRRSFSRAVERVVCRLCAVESFEAAVEDLYDIGGVSVSSKEAQLLSESVGTEIAREQGQEVEAVFTQDKEIEPEDVPDVLCVELDGKIVQTNDGGRELKVAAVSDLVVGKQKGPQDRLEANTVHLGTYDGYELVYL